MEQNNEMLEEIIEGVISYSYIPSSAGMKKSPYLTLNYKSRGKDGRLKESLIEIKDDFARNQVSVGGKIFIYKSRHSVAIHIRSRFLNRLKFSYEAKPDNIVMFDYLNIK